MYKILSEETTSWKEVAREPRFQQRLEELLDDAHVPRTLLEGLVERLDDFLRPLTQRLQRVEQVDNAHRYVAGLLSGLKRKNAEAIAYLHDEERQALQKFLGLAPWDTEPLLDEVTQEVADQLGETDGVLVFDPSAFPKCGTKSVGVQRQWCGRLGKVDNCQVGVYLGYVSRHEHALVDVRLYLPRSWATDKTRRREAVAEVAGRTVRASSVVENLNGRLRNYFYLRRHLGPSYLHLLQFLLNHRRFLRSEHAERAGKSPTELLTGEAHPHGLEMLGYKLFSRP